VYHSLRDAEGQAGQPLRWLDLFGLCGSLAHAMPLRTDPGSIVYFSALARHMERSRPGTVARHLRYLDALQACGIETRLGRFRQHQTRCPSCGRTWGRWEEKETDVAIASRLLRLAAARDFSQVALLTGDTDLVPAILEAKAMRTGLAIGVVFPAARANEHLRSAADWTIRLTAWSYVRHQFPDVVRGPRGQRIHRPTEWSPGAD
jgi:uncharacterized LabA/DUF88 family protein